MWNLEISFCFFSRIIRWQAEYLHFCMTICYVKLAWLNKDRNTNAFLLVNHFCPSQDRFQKLFLSMQFKTLNVKDVKENSTNKTQESCDLDGERKRGQGLQLVLGSGWVTATVPFVAPAAVLTPGWPCPTICGPIWGCPIEGPIWAAWAAAAAASCCWMEICRS